MIKEITKVVLFILALLLTTSSISAISIPFPIAGKVVGDTSGGLLIEVKNMRTGEIQTTVTTPQGEFLVDWANSDIPERNGDSFQIKVADKVLFVTYNGEPSLFAQISYDSPCVPNVCKACEVCQVCSECKECDEFKYAMVYEECDICQVCKECEACEVCQVCDECEECEDCSLIGPGMIIGLLAAIVAFMGGGIKMYKNRAGNITFLHRHKGIVGYHDPNTKHRNVMYRHRTWEESSTGCINDVRRIQEDGGLI